MPTARTPNGPFIPHLPFAPAGAKEAVIDTAERLRRYDLAKLEFEEAVLYKPIEGHKESAEATYAPLIVEESSARPTCEGETPEKAEREGPSKDSFGALTAATTDTIRVDTTRPAVYAGTRSLEIAGRSYTQMTYAWFYPVNNPITADGQGGEGKTPHAAIPWRALRMTLGPDGFPIVYEVAGSGMEGQRLFVSSSLEQKAKEMFDGPLDHRRFAVERSVDEAPAAVVIRVLEDGPIPMGPYVYVLVGSWEITTLLCRCSPSQVGKFTGSAYYEIHPLEEIERLLRRMDPNLGRFLAQNTEKSELPLDRALRVPFQQR